MTGDCGAVSGIWHSHLYTNSTADTVNAALYAGTDVDCGSFMGAATMLQLVSSGAVSTDKADAALRHLLRVHFRLGFFDPPDRVGPGFGLLNASAVNTPAHQALAKEAADQSLVLLKNNVSPAAGNSGGGPVLPLDPADKALRVAVIGPQANATANMQGNYFGDAPFLVSPLEGIASLNPGTTSYADGSDHAAAAALAAAADVAVVVVGLNSEAASPVDEAEGLDRTSLLLPRDQGSLVAAIAASGAPRVVLVLMSGGPLDVRDFRDDPSVAAILWCGYPGQAGGSAIADALFGVTNPSGKLTQTWYMGGALAKYRSYFDEKGVS